MPQSNQNQTGGAPELRPNPAARIRTGWASWLARFSMAVLLFETFTGLAITLAPFHPAVQYGVLVHTALGALTLLPVAWYCLRHWLDYRHWAMSHVTVLGYVALWGLVVCSVSGLVLMGEAVFGVRTSALWRQVHLISTLVMLAGLLPHLVLVWVKARKGEAAPAARGYIWQSLGVAALGVVLVAAMPALYSGVKYVNKFPADYNYLYGTNRPFAPSLAKTDTGGAFDGKSLAGSHSCGTARAAPESPMAIPSATAVSTSARAGCRPSRRARSATPTCSR